MSILGESFFAYSAPETIGRQLISSIRSLSLSSQDVLRLVVLTKNDLERKDESINETEKATTEKSKDSDSADAVKIYYLDNDFISSAGFADGLAAVQDSASGLWGFIDYTGEYVIEPAYYGAYIFTEGHDIIPIFIRNQLILIEFFIFQFRIRQTIKSIDILVIKKRMPFSDCQH